MSGRFRKIFFLAFVLISLLTVASAFSCDSGDISSTCHVSSVQDITSSEISGSGDLVIEDGGVLQTNGGPGSSSKLSFSEIRIKGALEGNFNISAGSLQITPNGLVSARGKGYTWSGENSDSGPGWGHGSHRCGVGLPDGAGGGGYFADRGGNGYFYLKSGDTSPEDQTGTVYGSKESAVRLGSAGGNGCDDSRGANGGGRLKVEVDSAQIDGSITASGNNGQCCNSNDGNKGAEGSGGGSGGSIRIQTDLLNGTGTLKSNGGDGANEGGGGSGGRIAIYYSENGTGTPDTTVSGGNGYQNGGKGTLYYNKTNTDFCGERGPKNECIIKQRKSLQPENYDIYSIFISRKTAFLESLNGMATINISNSSKISGTWKGSMHIQTFNPKINPGAKFTPKNGDIKIGK